MDTKSVFSKELTSTIFASKKTYFEFNELINSEKFTIENSPENHIILYFVPVNKMNKTVFLVHDIKVDLWLFPGGHLRRNELDKSAIQREVAEELGFSPMVKNISDPFLVTKTKSLNTKRPCIWHYDVWYQIEIDEGQINTENQNEFKEPKWVTVEEAKKVVTDPATLIALEKLHF